MHLLFTDPSTSPRTELGRMIFGILYGLSTVALYVLLGRAGLPTFYDKLLQVPLLNLSITLIDRLARSKTLRALDPAALGRSLVPRRRNLAYMSIWTIVFALMSAVQGVGDSHPGQWMPFWRQACKDERPYACPYVEDVLSSYCGRGSRWACNESSVLETQHGLDRAGAVESNAPPTLDDYPTILRGSKGPIVERTPAALYALACREGWPDTCGRTGDAGGR
jgi:hypothetical protein